MSVEGFVLERIAAAAIAREPFGHLVVDRIFPQEFYEEILEHWPAPERFVGNQEAGRIAYAAERRVLNLDAEHLARLEPGQAAFWKKEVCAWLRAGRVHEALAAKLGAVGAAAGEGVDAVIVSDRTAYALGPHTDTPAKRVSLLFYLPEDATFRRFGTSLYRPRDPQFRCATGQHYEARYFERVATIEFVPNRLLAFARSDRSFHGVEPVDLPGIERRLLLSSLRRLRRLRG